jgi:hypothetical protein
VREGEGRRIEKGIFLARPLLAGSASRPLLSFFPLFTLKFLRYFKSNN